MTIILLCPDTEVLTDGGCFVEDVSCGENETFVGCLAPGVEVVSLAQGEDMGR